MLQQFVYVRHITLFSEDNAVSFRAGFNECASEIIHYIMKLDDIDRTTKTKLLSYLATSCKLADSSPGQSFGIHSRVGKPITCSITPLSPSQSPTQIIPSPTSSSPTESHSPSAFSPPMTMLPRSPTEKNTGVTKPLALQPSIHINQKTFLPPKRPFSQKTMPESPVLAKAPVKPSLWRPW